MAGKPNNKWMQTMVKKHGSREAVRKHLQEIGARGGKKSRALDPESVEQKPVDINNEYTILDNGLLIGKEGSVKKPQMDKKGYMRVQVYVDGKPVTEKVHRLVARHFIPNPDNKPQVNHIDGDKTNNYANNLEWVTNKENFDHALENGLMRALFNQEVQRLLPQVKGAVEDGYLLKDICELNKLPYKTTMKHLPGAEPAAVKDLYLGRRKQLYYYDSNRGKYRVIKKDVGIPSATFETEEEAREYVNTHRGGGFASDRELARKAGAIGGRKSKRGKSKKES